MRTAAVAVLGLLVSAPALAEDPVDLGVLRNDELHVVQNMLYTKADKGEASVFLGAVAFDPYSVAPKLQFGYGAFLSETLGWKASLGVGWGLPNGTYRELDSPAYGKVPEAYRYIASVGVGVEWDPIYAKMSVNGDRVFHHDVYVPIEGGFTFERLIESDLADTFGQSLGLAPHLGLGVGARVYTHRGPAIKVEVRDDLLIQHRGASQSWKFKQNINVLVGFAWLSGGDR